MKHTFTTHYRRLVARSVNCEVSASDKGGRLEKAEEARLFLRELFRDRQPEKRLQTARLPS